MGWLICKYYFQPHLVMDSIQMKWMESSAIASWEFSVELVDSRNRQGAVHSGTRWGAMVILKSLEYLPTAVRAALKDLAHHSTAEGNMMHIALLHADKEKNIRKNRYIQVQWSNRIFICCL
jgi:acetyl-CoA carboxylase / biotin carboxylase 1